MIISIVIILIGLGWLLYETDFLRVNLMPVTTPEPEPILPVATGWESTFIESDLNVEFPAEAVSINTMEAKIES
jgi:hypothetical protein